MTAGRNPNRGRGPSGVGVISGISGTSLGRNANAAHAAGQVTQHRSKALMQTNFLVDSAAQSSISHINTRRTAEEQHQMPAKVHVLESFNSSQNKNYPNYDCNNQQNLSNVTIITKQKLNVDIPYSSSQHHIGEPLVTNSSGINNFVAEDNMVA